jgi:hypothetical protein
MPKRNNVDKVSGDWAESRYAMGAAYDGKVPIRPNKNPTGYDFIEKSVDKLGRVHTQYIEVKYNTARLRPKQKEMKAEKKGHYTEVRYKNMI